MSLFNAISGYISRRKIFMDIYTNRDIIGFFFLGYEIFILFSLMELDKLSLITVSSNFRRGKINGLNFNLYETRGLFHSIWKSIILRSPAVSTIIG